MKTFIVSSILPLLVQLGSYFPMESQVLGNKVTISGSTESFRIYPKVEIERKINSTKFVLKYNAKEKRTVMLFTLQF